MKIIVQPSICPVCRQHFSAYLAACVDPQRDEIDPSKRALLCDVCEQAFITRLYFALRAEGVDSRGLALSGLCLPALQKESHRAGERGQEAHVGTDQPSGLFADLQGMPDEGRNTDVPQRDGSVLEEAHPALRGPTVLPPDPAA